jgi:hypothetical protein
MGTPGGAGDWRAASFEAGPARLLATIRIEGRADG